jgi:hypothetical protein
MIPLRRLTTIIMPHRGQVATLRDRTKMSTPSQPKEDNQDFTQFRTMSAIQCLKFGLEGGWYKKAGWLLSLLTTAGTVPSNHLVTNLISKHFMFSILIDKMY